MDFLKQATTRVREWLSGPHTFWLCLLLFAVALLGGIRYPHTWAYTHYLFTYQEGVTKRSLIGEIVRQLGEPSLFEYPTFFCVSLAIFLATCASIVLVMHRMRERRWLSLNMALMAYASSFGVVYIAHTIGYADTLMVLLLCSTLLTRRFWSKMVLASVGMVFLVFVHESATILIFPILWTHLIWRARQDFDSAKLTAIVVLACTVVGLTWWIVGQTLEAAQVRRLYDAAVPIAGGANVRRDALAVLSRDGAENLETMWRLWTTTNHGRNVLGVVYVTAPVASYFVFLVLRFGRRAANATWWLLALTVMGMLTPCIMLGLGWDSGRWLSFLATTSLAGLVTIAQQVPKEDRGQRFAWFDVVGVGLVALHFYGSVAMMDGRVVERPPFDHHAQQIERWLEGEDSFFHPGEFRP